MISIIICSIDAALLQRVSANIAETIGVPFEIIAIDNSVNKKGICSVYNEAGSRANYPVLCFMHEDILFETKNWGNRVLDHLSKEGTGLIGVAGGDAKSLVPSSWSIPIVSNEINLVQHSKKDPAVSEHLTVSRMPKPVSSVNVVAVDGVWLCVKRAVFQRMKFDERLFRGFHGYDIDYSLQVGRQFEIHVVFDVLLHHYSEGTPNKHWALSAKAISEKWRKDLPVFTGHPAKRDQQLHHWHSLRVWVSHLKRLGFSQTYILREIAKYSNTRYFSVRRLLSILKFSLFS